MQRLLFAVMVWLLIGTSACQDSNAPPTLQPGEVEVPFETVVLAGEGVAVFTEPPQPYTISSLEEISQLQDLIEPAALQRLQTVDFGIYNLLAVFRAPLRICAGYGVTIDRLVRRAEVLTVTATDWEPDGGLACAETSVSGYHIIAVRKQNADLDKETLFLERQQKEREARLPKQI